MSELRIERSYPIAPEALFAYVTEAENLVKWWGPDGTTVKEADLDLTRKGRWSVRFESPRGPFAMHGEVREVIPPRIVTFTMNVPGQDDAPESTVRFEIAPDGAGGSRFTLIQSGITDQMVEMGKRGWGMTLARLETAMGIPRSTA